MLIILAGIYVELSVPPRNETCYTLKSSLKSSKRIQVFINFYEHFNKYRAYMVQNRLLT